MIVRMPNAMQQRHSVIEILSFRIAAIKGVEPNMFYAFVFAPYNTHIPHGSKK